MWEWERGTVGVGGRQCGRIHRREPKWEWVEGNVGVGGRQHIDKKNSCRNINTLSSKKVKQNWTNM